MAVLGRGITGLPLSSGSMLVGVGGIVDELPVGLPGQILTVIDNPNQSEPDFVQWANAATSGGTITNGENLVGSGAGIFAGVNGTSLQFKRISSGSSNVTVTAGLNEISISVASPPVSSVNSQTGAVSLGLSDLNDVLVGSQSNGQVLTWNGTKWAPATPATPGEVNTASNLGTGTGVFSQKSGVDLQFRSIKAGSGITVTLSGNDIVIDNTSPGGGSGGLTSVGLTSPNSTLTVGNSPLIANGNLTVDLPSISGVSGVHAIPSSITVDGYGRITAITDGTAVNPNKFLTFTAKDATTATASSDTSTFTFTGTDVTTSITGNTMNINLANVSGLTPGSYTRANITVDAKGRITAASSGTSPNSYGSVVTDSGTSSAGGSSVALTLNGINGITTSSDVGTGAVKVSLTTSGVTAGTYGSNSGTAAQITVDTYGRVTAAQNKTVLQAVSGDINPSLGGNLNVGPYEINTSSLNGNIKIRPNGTGSVDVNGAKIINLATPTSSNDAATKAYVDSMAGAGSGTLDGLVDVTITSPAQGQVLSYNSLSAQWENVAGVTDLNSLSDVNFGSPPTTGQYLYYNGTSWIAADIIIGTLDLDSLVDVTITSPTNNQFLTYDSGTSQWVNSTPVFFTTLVATTGNAQASSGQISVVGGTGIATSATGSTLTINNTKTALSMLDDVDFTTLPTANQMIRFNGTKWVPYTLPSYALYSITSIAADDTNTISINSSSASISVSGTNGINTSVSGNILNVNFAGAITNLSDIQLTSVADGESLVYNSTSGKWVNAASTTTIAGMTDVDVSTLADNYILKYSTATSKWVSVSPSTIAQNTFTSVVTGSGTITANSPTTALTITGINGISTAVNGGNVEIDAQLALGDLTNVSVAGPTPGQLLTWNGTNWIAANLAISVLDDLADVIITTPAADQLLVYNGTDWVNTTVNSLGSIAGNSGTLPIDSVSKAITISGSGGITTSVSGATLQVALTATLDDLTNVNVPTPSIGDVLYWTGTEWAAQAGGSFSLISDPNPTLGADLNTNGHQIVSNTDENIRIIPAGIGETVIGDVNYGNLTRVDVLGTAVSTVILTYPTSFEYMAVDYHYTSTNGKRIGTLLILNDGSLTSLTDTGTELGSPDVGFTVAINTSNVELTMVTPDDATVKFTTRKFQA